MWVNNILYRPGIVVQYLVGMHQVLEVDTVEYGTRPVIDKITE
jgi:hypothetical protein